MRAAQLDIQCVHRLQLRSYDKALLNSLRFQDLQPEEWKAGFQNPEWNRIACCHLRFMMRTFATLQTSTLECQALEGWIGYMDSKYSCVGRLEELAFGVIDCNTYQIIGYPRNGTCRNWLADILCLTSAAQEYARFLDEHGINR